MSRRSRSKAPPRLPTAPAATGGIWLRAGIIILAVCVVYSNSLSGPFVSDDHDSIVNNAAIREWWNLPRVFARQRNTPLAGRPIVALTFAMNFATDGLEPAAYHVTNVAIHAACALLLFGIVRRTLRLPRIAATYGGAAANLAFASALLWAVHPLATEAVDYLTQRTECLMALLLLGTLYAAIRAFTDRRNLLWQVVAVACCCAGMLCKETMVVAPVLVVLYDRIFLFDSLRDAVAARWRLYFALALTWIALLEMMLPGPRATTVHVSAPSASWNYLLNQAEMISRYFRLAIWPHGLVMDYGPPRALSLGDVWPQALLVLSLVAATAVALFRKPAIGFAGAWVFITLAPTSTIIPITTEVGAERRMYLPLMAITALIVVGVYNLDWFKRRIAPVGTAWLLAFVAAALSLATMARHREYTSRLTLAESVLRHWPTDVAHGLVGSALAAVQRDEEAIRELRLASRTDHRSRYNLGVELFNVRKLDEAIQELRRYVGEDPLAEMVPSAYNALGDSYALQRNWQQAVNQYRVALSMRPADAPLKGRLVNALNSRGLELVNGGQFTQAVAVFRQAAGLDPRHWSVRHNLAAALLDDRDPAAAEIEARTAVELNPADAGSYDLLGRALAVQGKLQEAITQLRAAAKLAPDDQQIQDDLERVLRLSRS